MSAVLVAVAAVVGLSSLLLALPLEVSFRFHGVEPFDGQVRIHWLFGLVRVRVRVPRPRKRPPRPRAEKAPRARPARRDARAALAVLRQPAFRRRAWRLVVDLLRAVRLHELGVRLRIGLGDPADTGRLWAIVGPLDAAARGLRNADVRIEPEFVEPVLDFDVHGRVLVVPARLLGPALAFALSPPSFRAWRTVRASRA